MGIGIRPVDAAPEKKVVDMDDEEVMALLLNQNSLINRVRMKAQYSGAKIEREFAQHHFGTVEWRRRQLALAQELIEMIRKES